MKFRKKPVVIDAIRFDGGNWSDIFDWAERLSNDVPPMQYLPAHNLLEVDTLEGVVIAGAGDWIICGIEGEFYPCKPSIFEATYESAETREKAGLE